MKMMVIRLQFILHLSHIKETYPQQLPFVTVLKNREILFYQEIFREINFVETFLLMLISRKFCNKMVAAKFRNFHTVSHSVKN